VFNVDAITVTRRFSTLRNRLAGFVEWKTGKPSRRFRIATAKKNHGITILYLYIIPNPNTNSNPIEYWQRIV